MKKLTKKIKKEIQDYIEKNQPKMDWNDNSFGESTTNKILEKGLDGYIDEVYESNIEYIIDLEDYLITELKEQWEDYDPNEITELSREFICVDMNLKNLFSNLPDIPCMISVYSNYDCCNSFDKMEPNSYLGEVYKRVKAGVKKDDYLWEFNNGAYGGSLFCFVFKTDVKNLLELLEEIKTGKTIKIPKDTQFGFFSTFQGSGSIFEKTTYRDMILPITGETKYDTIGITADSSQSYNMTDVYGDTSFVKDGNIIIK